jgi:D-sedoheptulose 7-phosphate isomerase
MELYQLLSSYFSELSVALLAVDREELMKAIELLRKAQEGRATVWIVGNGGSAATAEHFANDLVKMCGIKAIAIPALMPTVTAFGNDDGWTKMFSNVLEVFQEPQDVLVAISCSGQSLNVVDAARGVENLIVLTGSDYQENRLVHMRSHAIIPVISEAITIQEDVHLAICHAITKVLMK